MSSVIDDSYAELMVDAAMFDRGFRTIQKTFSDAVSRMNGFPGTEAEFKKYMESMRTIEDIGNRFRSVAADKLHMEDDDKLVGRAYGDVIRPDPKDYTLCRFAKVTDCQEIIAGVYVRLVDGEGAVLRPCYDIVAHTEGVFYNVCYDYDPNTGRWKSADANVPLSKARKKVRQNGNIPLPSFEIQEVFL